MTTGISELQLKTDARMLLANGSRPEELPNGSLVASRNNLNRVYQVHNGALWLLPNQVTAERLIDANGRVKPLDSSALADMPSAGILPTMNIT